MAAAENGLLLPTAGNSTHAGVLQARKLKKMTKKFQTSMSHPPSSTGNDLLGLDILDAWSAPDKKNSIPVQVSPLDWV